MHHAVAADEARGRIRLGAEIGVDDRARVAARPAGVRPVLDPVERLRWHVVAQHVAAVDGRPGSSRRVDGDARPRSAGRRMKTREFEPSGVGDQDGGPPRILLPADVAASSRRSRVVGHPAARATVRVVWTPPARQIEDGPPGALAEVRPELDGEERAVARPRTACRRRRRRASGRRRSRCRRRPSHRRPRRRRDRAAPTTRSLPRSATSRVPSGAMAMKRGPIRSVANGATV